MRTDMSRPEGYYRTPESKARDAKKKNKKREKRKSQINQCKKECQLCGENNPVCLDLHHHNDNKFLGVSKLLMRNINLLKEEIAKCCVVCANCHRKIHNGDLSDKNLAPVSEETIKAAFRDTGNAPA